MKLTKLSLAAIVVASLTTSSFAADTLADAFKEGKVSGAIKGFYMKTSKDVAGTDTGALATGGVLKYATGSLNGLSATFEFQTSHTMGVEVGDSEDTSVGIRANLLSEAYLAYTMNKTTVKVGRMHIGTPLVSDSGSRLIRDYFTAAVVVNTSLENTTLVGGAVTELTGRDGSITKLDDPAYTVYANSAFGPVGVSAQYLLVQSNAGDVDQYWAEGTYSIKGDMPVDIAAQYIGIGTTYDSKLLGLMVSTNVSGLGLMAAYTTTDSDGDVPGGVGAGSDSSYNSVQKLSGNGAGVDSYQGKVSYDFKNGLSAFTRYVNFSDYSGAGLDATEWDVDATYKFDGSLKGLTTQVRYAMVSKDVANSDYNDFRFIVNYNF